MARTRIIRQTAVAATLVVAAITAVTAKSQTPPAPTPEVDVVGSMLHARLPDGRIITGRALIGATLIAVVGGRKLRVRISDVQKDKSDPRNEVLLYDFRVLTPFGEEPMCVAAPDGVRLGLPIGGHSNAAGIISQTDDNSFELVCAAGPLGKCARFGYGPWRQASDGRPMRDWFNACVRMLRGDYCGDGRPFTRNGTWIDFYDTIGVQKSDQDPSLTFEAGWGPEGAVCVARTRLPDIITPAGLLAACPRLKNRVGEMCTEAKARSLGARLFNRSRE